MSRYTEKNLHTYKKSLDTPPRDPLTSHLFDAYVTGGSQVSALTFYLHMHIEKQQITISI